jgi:eukaryotic-like serine/threonine-protein kinase
MGEVYRATDTNLKRQVAIKVLPSAVAGDAERLVRFQREAEMLAALNHPNIAHIHGLEKSDGRIALVMELVEGPTLADRIAHGPIPIAEALPIAKQIADALEAAHEQGIIHRDLKPANIKLRPDGTAKILDFGLAKALEPPHSAPTNVSLSPTITSPAMTQAGIILGTAAYMSPEQAAGKPADKRSDVWSFGIVLMEMLTGRQLFDGETVSHVLAAVLTREPDWTKLPANTPARLRVLLRRCLERDPKRRLRDIGEARVALEDVAAGHDDLPSAAVTSSPRRVRIWPWLLGVGSVALVAFMIGRYVFAPASGRPRPVRFEIRAGDVSSAVLSPDGTQLAIVSEGHLWVRDLARLETRPLEKTDGAVRPFWSPDSRTIAYGARGKLWKVLADGGTPSVICDLVSGLWDDDAGGAWLSDGTIVYSDGNVALWQVSAQGGDPAQVLKPDPQRELHFHTVGVLPDGRSVVYTVHRAGEGVGTNTLGIWSNRQAHVLLELAGQTLNDPVYAPSGHILFSRTPTNAGVWALPFSLKTLKAEGEPFLVAQGMRSPSAAVDGTLVMLPPRRQRPLNLAWTDRAGNILSRIDEPRLRQTTAAISPDGNRVAVVEAIEGKTDLWQYDIQRNTRTRLTVSGSASEPVWLADGSSLLLTGRAQSGQGVAIQRVSADGSGRAEEVVSGRRPAASRDGTTVFFSMTDKDGMRLWYRPLAPRDGKSARFLDQAFYAITAAPSPDGRLVAYEAEPGPDQSEIYVRRFPPSEGMWQVSTGGGTSPRWSRDGHLYYANGADIFEVEVAVDPDVRIGTPVRLFKRTPTGGSAPPPEFDVSPDGKRFLIYEPVGDPAERGIAVVQHWFSEFVH